MENLSVIQNYLKDQPVLKAYLFGSYARGEQDTSSDFDLLVELEEHVGLYQFVAIQLGLENLLGKKVDLVSEKGLSPRLKPYIDKDKRLIYERQPGDKERLRHLLSAIESIETFCKGMDEVHVPK